ncbi:NINE protein [Propioniciclava coleopterorum]|uniref:NINE protein n=1 Tax=Propioniciclava coleopterorum TaxID=2714937 RepID=A0A6G7Y360_9ACTN|nr:TM2 domain-containing protein [Propioniciclava coleopterorum]QIK71126.1 NINE protein [Propioniciclava coleopterorum]
MSDPQSPPPFPDFGKPLSADPAEPLASREAPFPDFGKPLAADPAEPLGSPGVPFTTPTFDAGPSPYGTGRTAEPRGFEAPGFGTPADPYATGFGTPTNAYATGFGSNPGGYDASAGRPAPPYAPAPYPVPAYGVMGPGYGVGISAPYGLDPLTGIPYSDKSKLAAGLLQIFLGWLGVGRFYMGNVGMGIAQILVTFLTMGFGILWPVIDGIIILAGSPRDSAGRPLRP